MGLVDYEETDTEDQRVNAVRSSSAAKRSIALQPHRGVGILKTPAKMDHKSINAARRCGSVRATPSKVAGVGSLRTPTKKDHRSIDAARRDGFVNEIPKKGPTISQPSLVDKPTSNARPGSQIRKVVAFPVHPDTFDRLRKSTDPLFEGEWRRLPGEVNPGETITVGGVSRKVISMKDAMEGELAYKKRLQVLQKKIRNDFPNPNKITQEVPSDISNTGIKRKEPPANLACSSSQHVPKLNTPQACGRSTTAIYKCMECNLTCTGLFDLQQHYHGRKHKTRLEELKFQNGGITEGTGRLYIQYTPERSDPVIYKCEECNVICAGPFNLQQHYQGKKHKTRVEELKLQKDGETEGMGPVRCSVCKIICMGEHNLREHLAGRKHAACLQAVRGTISLPPMGTDVSWELH